MCIRDRDSCPGAPGALNYLAERPEGRSRCRSAARADDGCLARVPFPVVPEHARGEHARLDTGDGVAVRDDARELEDGDAVGVGPQLLLDIAEDLQLIRLVEGRLQLVVESVDLVARETGEVVATVRTEGRSRLTDAERGGLPAEQRGVVGTAACLLYT